MARHPASPQTPPPSPRKAAKELRRQQIIDATISTLAQRGYAAISLSDVAREAGISYGLVSFYFQSKERLLSETLLHLSEDYRQCWTEALARAPADPASQLDALLSVEFDSRVSSPEKLSAWYTFWGEAQCRPIYQKHCGANDDGYIREIERICTRLIGEGGYPHDPVHAARLLRILKEGVFLDLVLMTPPYSRAEALHTVYFTAATLFPRHFGPGGLISPAARGKA